MSTVSDEIKKNFQTQNNVDDLIQNRQPLPIELRQEDKIKEPSTLPHKNKLISSKILPPQKAYTRSPSVIFFRSLFNLTD